MDLTPQDLTDATIWLRKALVEYGLPNSRAASAHLHAVDGTENDESQFDLEFCVSSETDKASLRYTSKTLRAIAAADQQTLAAESSGIANYLLTLLP